MRRRQVGLKVDEVQIMGSTIQIHKRGEEDTTGQVQRRDSGHIGQRTLNRCQ